MKDLVILLLVLAAGTFGFLWHGKVKSVEGLGQELSALTEQRDELQQTNADLRANCEKNASELRVPPPEKSIETLTSELDELKAERDRLAEECETWMEKAAAIQKHSDRSHN